MLKGKPFTLSVAATSPDGGTLSYQWYAGGEEIKGATSTSYTIENVEKTQVYYVVVTNTKDGKSKSKQSDKITITMTEKESEVTVAAPDITVDLPEIERLSDGATVTLKITAVSPDGGTLSYQWYAAEDADSEGKEIPGANLSEYTATMSGTTRYYYVVVTNAKNGKTATQRSRRTHVMPDKDIRVTLDIETVQYEKLSENIKAMKFRDGTSESKTVTVKSGTTLAEIIKENDAIPVATVEIMTGEETESTEICYMLGSFWNEQFTTKEDLYDFYEKDASEIEELFHTPLDSDCTFYAYTERYLDTELYEDESLAGWAQKGMPFYVKSETAWIRFNFDGWLCWYESVDGGAVTINELDTVVELKPSVCLKDEKKAIKIEGPAPGLYAFECSDDTFFRSDGTMKIKLVKSTLIEDEKLYFLSSQTSWDFNENSSSSDDTYTFVAKAETDEFKVSTYDWAMRFASDTTLTPDSGVVPLHVCGSDASGQDKNGEISGLTIGEKYTVKLERDASGMPVKIVLEHKPWTDEKAIYFMSKITGWDFVDAALFKDSVYTFVANAEAVDFKVIVGNSWEDAQFAGGCDFSEDNTIWLRPWDGTDGSDGTISELTPGATYTATLIRDVDGVPERLVLKKIQDAPVLKIEDVKIVLSGDKETVRSLTRDSDSSGHYIFSWKYAGCSLLLSAGSLSYGAETYDVVSAAKKGETPTYCKLYAGKSSVRISGFPVIIPDDGYLWKISVKLDGQELSVAVSAEDEIPDNAFEGADSVCFVDGLSYICSNCGDYQLEWKKSEESGGSYLAVITIPADIGCAEWEGRDGIQFGIVDSDKWNIKWVDAIAAAEDTFVDCTRNEGLNNLIPNVTPAEGDIVITVKSTAQGISFKYTVNPSE